MRRRRRLLLLQLLLLGLLLLWWLLLLARRGPSIMLRWRRSEPSRRRALHPNINAWHHIIRVHCAAAAPVGTASVLPLLPLAPCKRGMRVDNFTTSKTRKANNRALHDAANRCLPTLSPAGGGLNLMVTPPASSVCAAPACR